jgi:hypothetical protein
LSFFQDNLKNSLFLNFFSNFSQQLAPNDIAASLIATDFTWMS